jgi:protein SDA1
MLQDPNETATKRAISVMIELYKRRIWNDDKTVNVIASGVLHENPKVVAASAKFFLVMDYIFESDTESEGESSAEEDRKLVLGKYKGTKKMTKGRITRVDRAIK